MLGAPKSNLSRKALERIDLLLLLIEAIEINGNKSMLAISHRKGLMKIFPNSVELWKLRCRNPLRKTSRRGNLSEDEVNAFLILISSMADKLYPKLRQLLSTKEAKSINKEKWNHLHERLLHLIEERMKFNRSFIKRILSTNYSDVFQKELVVNLAFSSGEGGIDRLKSSLYDLN